MCVCVYVSGLSAGFPFFFLSFFLYFSISLFLYFSISLFLSFPSFRSSASSGGKHGHSHQPAGAGVGGGGGGLNLADVIPPPPKHPPPGEYGSTPPDSPLSSARTRSPQVNHPLGTPYHSTPCHRTPYHPTQSDTSRF